MGIVNHLLILHGVEGLLLVLFSNGLLLQVILVLVDGLHHLAFLLHEVLFVKILLVATLIHLHAERLCKCVQLATALLDLLFDLLVMLGCLHLVDNCPQGSSFFAL